MICSIDQMGKYFSKQGMYFQTPGDDTEDIYDIQIPMEVIRQYILIGGHSGEVTEALDYIAKEYPRARPIVEKLRVYLLMDDFFMGEERYKLAADEYHRLIRRLT